MKKTLNGLFQIQNKLASFAPSEFRRYLKVNWDKRLIVLIGARGTGKTTFVLQHYLERYGSIDKCLYFSVDNPLVAKFGIYAIAKEYFALYGDAVIIDEVHKQENWSLDVKALYDAFPDKKIVILGSSKLNILNQKGDLSRRAVVYNLKGLSFREFLELKYGKKLQAYSLEEILSNHISISSQISQKIPELKKYFWEYKRFGFYPFFVEYSDLEYQQALYNVLDKVIYEDIPTLKNIKSSSSYQFKKLLAYLAMSTIPTVVVASMCNELDINKETLYEYLDLMDRAEMINIVRRQKSSVRSLQRAKVLLSNPNLYYTVSSELWKHTSDLGNIRESFFVSQLGDQLSASKFVDYTMQTTGGAVEVEIGGRSKSRKQIKQLENAYVLRDDIEIGFDNVVPLFLFGFLY